MKAKALINLLVLIQQLIGPITSIVRKLGAKRRD